MHHRPLEPLLPHPPGVPPQSFRRYDHFDVAPPGTGPDIPGIGSSYEKPRYERSSYENRQLPLEDFLTPPGVDHRYRDRDRDVPGNRERDIGPPGVRDRDIGPPGMRDRDVGIRDRDMGMPSMRDRDRDIGPPGVRDRDLGPPLWDSRERGSRDDLPLGRDGLISRERDMGLSDRPKDRDRDRDVRERDGDRDRDRGRGDYYESDHRRSYDKGYGSYNSPDVKKRKQSLSPGPGRHERYSSSERHHRRGSDRRKNSGTIQVSQGGKENRHMSQQQPLETVVDTAGGQRERDKDTQKRERVLVEVRKEPSVDCLKKDDKGKKEEDNKKGKDKKKKKREKEPEGEKLKKKRRKEKKEGKKEGQEAQEKMKVVVKGTERKVHHKEKEGEEKAETEEDKGEEKPAVISGPVQLEKKVLTLTTSTIMEKVKATTLRTFDAPPTESIVDGLYGDMEDTRIDDNVIANYGKVMVEEVQERKVELDVADKGTEVGQEVGGGVELRVKTDTGSDSEGAVKFVAPDPVKANVMLAPLPEPSKWELEEEFTPGSSFEKKESEDGADGGSQGDKAAGKVVTSEVLKRAENAIFQKAINAIRPIEPPKKVSNDRKVYTSSEKRVPVEVMVPETVETRKVPEKDTREARKTANSIQITIPTAGHVERSVEIASLESSSQPVSKGKGKLDRSKFSTGSSSQWGDGTDSTSPHRVPAKERLGARVDGDGDRKKDDGKESKRHHSRSESRERKHSAAKKGLKSAVEKKHTISRSRSRSPHHRKSGDRKESKYAEEARRYDVAGDRRYVSGDSRSKRGDREGRYADMDRERRPLDRGGGDSRRREHSESKKWDESRDRKEIIKSPDRRRERSESHEAKVEKSRSKPKEDREKSVEKGKTRHKAKKKTKNRRSESRSRKKSVSDRELKRGKKKDRKHKKEKGKKHKQRDEKSEKKENENGKEKEEERDEKSEAVKEVKAGTSNDIVPGIGNDDGKVAGTLETVGEQNKDKPRKGGRRNPRLASDRKKSTLDEASFEPDYDASSSVDTDADDGGDNEKKQDGSGDKKLESNVSPGKKRDRSASIDPAVAEQKRQKLDKESDKSEKATTDDAGKKGSSKASATKGGSTKKRDRSLSSSDSSDDDSSDDDDDDSSSGSSSSSDDDSSDDSSVHRRQKKKSHHRRRGKRNKKSSRRASNSSSDSESESESASSSDSDGGRGRKGGGRSSKKHRHRNKISKKKKKSSKHR